MATALAYAYVALMAVFGAIILVLNVRALVRQRFEWPRSDRWLRYDPKRDRWTR